MNRRIRSNNRQVSTATYLRFLRPGALAQLRDSKLKSRSHKAQIYRLRPSSTPLSPARAPAVQQGGGGGANEVDLPFGSTARVYAPRCPQRKKMTAIRAVIDVYESVVVVVVGGGDGFSNDFVAAH